MKKYLVIYFGGATESEKSLPPDKPAQQEFMNAWANWAGKHKDSVLDFGSPLGRAQFLNHAGVRSGKSGMTAYSIVQAESREQAAAIFAEHPHLMLHSGNSIEIMEMLAVPDSNR